MAGFITPGCKMKQNGPVASFNVGKDAPDKVREFLGKARIATIQVDGENWMLSCTDSRRTRRSHQVAEPMTQRY